MLEIHPHQIFLFAAPLIISSLLLMMLHWFPWGRVLSRPTSYAIGTGITMGMPIASMLVAVEMGLSQGELFWASLLITNAIVSGAAVLLCYLIDSKISKPITLDEVADGATNGR